MGLKIFGVLMLRFKVNRNFIYAIVFAFAVNSLFSKTDSIPGIGIITPTYDNQSKSGYYIPTDLKDCFSEIDKLLPEEVVENINENDIFDGRKQYQPLVQWIYVNWGMEDTTRIVEYFNQFGFDDAANIAQAIYDSYLKHKKGEKIRLEIKPKVYIHNQNMFLIKADTIIVPPAIPNPKGVVNFDSTEMKPQFNFMGGTFRLIDSIYAPIVQMLYDNGFQPSPNLWYVWWTQVAKFGEGVDTIPYFLTEDDMNAKFKKDLCYNADFILIFEDRETPIPKSILRDNKFQFGFQEYLNTHRHFGFYLIRQKEVVYFE